MRAIRSLLAVTVLLLGHAGVAQTLVVSAASSLTEAFEDVASAFEARHDGVEVLLNLAGSSTLSTQIIQGAPIDVFASADVAQMRVVEEAGLLAAEAKRFAGNRLIVIARQDGPVRTLEDLAGDGLQLVLAGPEVPVGAYARQALAAMDARFGAGFEGAVLANLVSEEPNARLVAAKVRLGEADAAIVYATDAVAVPESRVID
ncbi:MAG: molybdate ABC transporter substrate-binding protein, partial [Deinococcus-Thermus bacterium]|nr:molybdate ABC transporter substrate-binding protein [Deinococcota bacterium]